MECLYGFASSVTRDLVCGALNQLRYPCCFNNFIRKLEKEEDDLIVTRDGVKKFVEHAKRQTRKTSELVDTWLENANSDVDNVNQLLKEARTKKICCLGHCPNWIWRYRVGKKLANKTVDLEKFIEEGRKYVPLDRIATLPSGILDILSEKCMNFESRQSAYEQLLEAVKSDDVAMIGLYGMGGCGKTTLAMEVRKLAEAEHLFYKVLFVPVSSTVDVRRIQEKIASSMQYTFPENEEMERAQRLCLRLTQEKNILLILDDVWEKLDFGRIGIPSSEHHEGCKILITTRSEEVCTSMDCQRKIYLPILTDVEAWTLFQNKALISEDTPNTIKHLARLISDECKGLPVAIAAVACSLKGKAESIWSVALNKLRSSKPINIERGLTDPYKCLQLSYDNLDTKEAKSLFLLCSVFPEDSEIPLELLTRCAIGLGVVGETHSYEEARIEVIAAKIKLVSSCLLLDHNNDDDEECVKVHDIVRDVAHLIAKSENKVIKCEIEKDVTLDQNPVTYLWCEKFPNDLDCSNLEFLCILKLEDLDRIFERMGMVRVLILVNQKKEKLPLSTMSFKTLTNLRCLILFNCELSDFSFVRDMKKLQSLSLNCCSLPSFLELQTDVAVTQLTTLKLLELNKCDIKGKNFEVIKRTPLLEELYIVDIEGEWEVDSEDTIEFFDTFSVPQTLQRYGIVLGSDNFYEYDEEEFCSHQRTLLLNFFQISNEVIKGLAKKAKDLFLANIQGSVKNIVPDIFEIEGGGMNEVNKLEIRSSEKIECLIDTSNHLSEVTTPFSKLNTLRIGKMKHLRALWQGFLPVNGPFENLEKLYLSDCPGFTSLFTYSVARSLVQLKTLKISRCDGLKHILAVDDKTEKRHDEFTSGNLVQIVIFQNLEEVEVRECTQLKHIFSASIVGGLTQLKVLKIEKCDMLDQIIGDIVPSADQDGKELDEIIEEGKHPPLYNPHLESNQLDVFPESTSIPSTTVVKHSSGTLSSLATLRIIHCPKLGSIFTASTTKIVISLEELFIEDCHSLEHIVAHERVRKNQKENIAEVDHDFQSDISIFQSLKKLHISRCELLQRILPVSFVGGMTNLNDIRNKEAVDLNDFSSPNNFEDNSCHQQQNNTPIELPALEVLVLDDNLDSIILDSNHVRCPSLRTLSFGIGRYVGFFTTKCSTDASNATLGDYIAIKISNSDSIHSVESAQDLPKQPQGLNLLIMKNIKDIKLKGFDKVKYLFKLSVASSLMLEFLTIEKCPGLEHIINTNDEYDKENLNAIFPNLRHFSVRDCGQLEYMLGQYPVANQDYKEIHIHFPALETLSLHNLPNFVSFCATNNLSVTWPSLKKLVCDGCSYPFNDSISCLTVPMDSREPISTSRKDPKGIQTNFLTLQTLHITNAEVEDVFCLNGHRMIGQQVSLRLENLLLRNLPQMTYIWLASKNSVTLQHLIRLEIVGCAKLEVIFPPSILRSLPELESLDIRECMELKQIMEEDADNKKLSNLLSTQPCFPKLVRLFVAECHKLKRLLSSSNDLPNLKFLTINGASELEEIIGCEQGASNNYFSFPNLKKLEIIGCTKLEVIFPKFVLRCLPELNCLEIKECKELRQIIEEDVGDKKLSNLLSPQPCFPGLEALLVEQCHKLKRFFSGSASNDLHNLRLLIISGASELEELIGGDEKGKTKVELPRLKLIIFMHLPNFLQEIELLSVKNCIVNECPKLSLTSTTTLVKLREKFPYKDFENTELRRWYFDELIRNLDKDSSTELPSSQINEKPKMEFIEKDPGSEVLGTTTSTDSKHNERPSLSPLDICQHETHSQEIGELGNENIKEGPAAEGAKTKSLSAGVEDISFRDGAATYIESSGLDILAHDSKVVEQDDKMNEGTTRVMPSQEIQVQEGLNLLGKQRGIETVSNNIIDTSPASKDIRTRLGAYKQFVDLDDTQIALLVEAITTYPHLWNACEKFSERFQAWRLKILADMLCFLHNEIVDSVIPQKEKKFHKLCDEAIEIGFECSWVDEMRQRVVARDPELGEDIAQGQIDENCKRSSGADMVPYSQVVEQVDVCNENRIETSPYLKIQNVNSNFQEGSNLIDKEGEIGDVSNDCIVALRHEEPVKEYGAKASTSEIPRIDTLLKNSQPVDGPSTSYLNIPLRETHSNGLLDKQWGNEPCLMNHQKPLGEINIKRVAVGETIAKNTNMAASSVHSESHPHSESEGHPKIVQGFGDNDIIRLFSSLTVGEGEDNRVGKTLVDLEKYLKMSLKDIVSSETNTLHVLTALKFLSNLPFKDVTLSDGLKDVIDSMHQEFPSIIRSFKQGFATTDKFTVLETRQNEVAITLFSKISEAGHFMDEAKQKEIILKEQVIRLKEEIKVCEAALSSLEEEKNKCITETVGYKKELENVRKDKSQTVEDQRKVRQELFEVAYKWSVLCSQFEQNLVPARNPS
ncbi:unnamed protein product [Sphenostylis stenocarpa]|uniref:NB-ARC domain-containing protein n=1 Tax=Sphenostylis stenocarpa TaxID=92480 RepID=A0AA86RXG5_9FABA|nr:unnamed protein product [Sphenostylis stenocarpa]